MDLDIYCVCIQIKDDTALHEIFHRIAQEGSSLPSSWASSHHSSAMRDGPRKGCGNYPQCPRTRERWVLLRYPVVNLVNAASSLLRIQTLRMSRPTASIPASLDLHFSFIRSLRSSIDMQSSIPRPRFSRRVDPQEGKLAVGGSGFVAYGRKKCRGLGRRRNERAALCRKAMTAWYMSPAIRLDARWFLYWKEE